MRRHTHVACWTENAVFMKGGERFVYQIESTNLICTSKVTRRQFKYLQMKKSVARGSNVYLPLYLGETINWEKERKQPKQKMRTAKVANGSRSGGGGWIERFVDSTENDTMPPEISAIHKSPPMKRTSANIPCTIIMLSQGNGMATNRIHWITKGTPKCDTFLSIFSTVNAKMFKQNVPHSIAQHNDKPDDVSISTLPRCELQAKRII